MIRFNVSRRGKSTEQSFTKILRGDIYRDLHTFGQRGVDALSNATPRETGATAGAWIYRIIRARGGIYGIAFYNLNEVRGNNIAIMLQYGHGTGTGGYVQGRDYINPAIQPIFDKMAVDVWKRVTAS